MNPLYIAQSVLIPIFLQVVTLRRLQSNLIQLFSNPKSKSAWMKPSGEIELFGPALQIPIRYQLNSVHFFFKGYVYKDRSAEIYINISESDPENYILFRSAISDSGEQFQLVPLYRGINSGAGNDINPPKYYAETVGIAVPIDYLRQRADTGITLKIVGQTRTHIVSISAAYSKGFLSKLETYL